MKNDLIDINEAASICGKSLQTIRRAIKAKKLSARRLRTPQGFNYMISRQSVMDFFGVKKTSEGLRAIPVEEAFQAPSSSSSLPKQESDFSSSENKTVAVDYSKDIHDLKSNLQNVVQQYHKEREHVSLVVKELQDRILVMEHQVHMLSGPKKKWYQIWK